MSLALLLCSAAAYAGVSNVYDELGRLVQVVAPDGDSVQYKYDAVGNITEVKRYPANVLALTEFTPNAGPSGTAVTIYGSGFSTVAAENTVKFNGKAATVQSATANKLVVKVPAGATTGRITVSNSKGQVTSATDFVTGADRPIPVITSITPNIGKPADVVTIAGNNFQIGVVDNAVSFGNGPAQIVSDADSPSPTLLKSKVPPGAPSGPITVATRFGKSGKSADFFAVPGVHLVSDIEYKSRAVLDSVAVPLAISTQGKKALVIFDANPGQYLSLVTSGGTFASSATIEVYRPDGVLAESSSSVSASGVVDFTKPLTAYGTYTLVFIPKPTETGAINLSLVANVQGALTIDDPSPTLATLKAGQNARYTFNGVTGKNLQLLLTNNTLDDGNTGTNNYTYVYVYKPDGSILTSAYQYTSDRAGFLLSLPALPGDGAYSVLVRPDGFDEGQIKLHLRTANSGTALATDATVTTVNVADQELGYYSFTGVAGRGYGLAVKDLVFTPGVNSPSLYAYLYKPDGTYVTSCNFSSAGDCDFAASNFTVDGKYGLVFVPRYQNSVSFKVQLG
ncbi:IPT/TIG domain-containing protein, partial [Ideonella sp. DXS29W]